jgi:hypothetical protein
MVDAAKSAISEPGLRRDCWATSFAVRVAGVVLIFAAACDPASHAASEPSAVPGRGSSTGSATPAVTSTSSAVPTVTAGSAVAPADPCAELRKTVVEEAGKLAACKTDTDCAVHPIRLCDFAELDCYAAHVNKGSSTTDFDNAVSAYAKSCPLSKCKCESPGKSVCNSGKCSGK